MGAVSIPVITRTRPDVDPALNAFLYGEVEHLNGFLLAPYVRTAQGASVGDKT